jgi:hypothetical protein
MRSRDHSWARLDAPPIEGDGERPPARLRTTKEAVVKPTLRQLRSALSTLTILLGISWPGPASTTVVVRADLPMLAREADCILEGRVFHVWSAWNERHSQIYTHVILDVNRVHGGNCRLGRTEIKILGGTVKDTTLAITGAPTFTTGEDVVLFMNGVPGAFVPILGLAQGKLLKSKDSRTSIERIGNPTVGYFERADFTTIVARERTRRMGR